MLALFNEYPVMTNSYGCFSTHHVALAGGHPIDNYSCTLNIILHEYRKTLTRSICLEMPRALSVIKSYQLKIT